MELANSTKNLKGQEMFQILAKARELERQGKEIIHFELGDPDFDTPKNITNAGCKSIKNGETHYVPSGGILKLKEAAVEFTKKNRRGFKLDIDQLLVTHGANPQIYFGMVCTTNPGEEVIIPDPGFVSYFSIADYLGIKSVRVPVHEKNEFKLDPDDVKKAITKNTKMILINSPSNPLGSIMGEEEIEGIFKIAEENNIYLMSDEIYSELIYDETKFFSPSIYDKCKERTIIINGFSKAYAMTGWRLGIMTAPKEIIKKSELILETILSCVPPFVQKAGIEALASGREVTTKMRKEYKNRRDVLVEGLNSLPMISCVKPQGAFYAFPNIKKTEMNSRKFANFMLEEAGVALSPGTIFGENGEGYARLSYATSIENIKKGIEKMRYSLKNL